jgi:anti-anti-sigma factor
MDNKPLSLTFRVDRNADIAVVHCRGVVASGLADHLDTLVGKLIPHNRLIMIDLEEVTWADSKGVETLARLFQTGSDAGCRVRLINAERNLSSVSGLMNLQAIGNPALDRRKIPPA